MAETRTVKLREPIQVGGKEVTEVTLRRSTVGDEEDAMQQAVQLKRGKNPVTVEMCLFARVTRLPYDAIRALHGRDYAAIREAFNDLNGYAPRDDDGDADDGNPTTPPTMQETA